MFDSGSADGIHRLSSRHFFVAVPDYVSRFGRVPMECFDAEIELPAPRPFVQCRR